MVNTNKLKGAIVAMGLTQEKVANCLGISARGLNNKITNKNEFTASEMEKLIKLLNIEDIMPIFFANNVPAMSTERRNSNV